MADKLPRAGFVNVEFPVTDVEVIGGVRDHVHEYPHVDGGDPELLGRKLYVVKMKANFQRTFKAWPGLYPAKLDALMQALEASKIGELVIPRLGTMLAYCTNWSRKMSARLQSGELVDLEFREQSIVSRAKALIEQRAATLSDAPLIEEAKKKPSLLEAISDKITDIQNAINGVTAYLDQAEMYGNLLGAKLAQLDRAIQELERVDGMQEAENYPVFNALQDLKATTVDLIVDPVGGGGIDLFVVPMTMPIQQVSVAIYGDASRAMELLDLNPIEDAFAVQAGEVIRFYRNGLV